MDFRFKRCTHGNKGFTLLELMIILAVLAVVITIAVPILTSSKKRANEISAIVSLRVICKSEIEHRNRYGTYTTLANLESRGLIDSTFTDAMKSGYLFFEAAVPNLDYWAIRAIPTDPGVSGDRFFYVNASGVIRVRDGAVAGPTDSPVD